MTILTPTTSLDQSREAHPLPPPTMLHVPNIYHPTKRILCNMGPCCIRIETSRATKETRRPYEGSLKRQAMFSVNGWIFPLCRKRIFLVLFFYYSLICCSEYWYRKDRKGRKTEPAPSDPSGTTPENSTPLTMLYR